MQGEGGYIGGQEGGLEVRRAVQRGEKQGAIGPAAPPAAAGQVVLHREREALILCAAVNVVGFEKR